MVSKPLFQRPTPIATDPDEVLLKLAYLNDPANVKFVECREQRHWWKLQHKGWLRPTSNEPFQKTYKCDNHCGTAKVVKRIDGVYRNFYYRDPRYSIKGARLTCQDIRDYEIAQAEALERAALKVAPAKPPKPPTRTRTQRAAGYTAKQAEVPKGRKR